MAEGPRQCQIIDSSVEDFFIITQSVLQLFHVEYLEL